MATRRIAVTGSTGMIGEAVVRELRGRGTVVHRVVREREAARGDDLYWDPARGEIDAARLEGLDGVIHLAGAPIGPRLWTAGAKRQILESRSQGTGLLATTLAALDDPPPVLLSASGIGWYGADRGDEVLTEASDGPGEGFLATVCAVWEDSTAVASEDGRIRVCRLRSGLVLSRDAGLLRYLRLPFQLGVGGKLGAGRHWMSWISLEDEVRAIAFLLDAEGVSGPVNLTGPAPVTNAEFTRALGEVLRRPTVMPVPRAAISAVLGEMGDEMAFANQRVLPTVLEEHGFDHRHRHVRAALRTTLGR